MVAWRADGFAGFDGFDDEVEDEYDERAGWVGGQQGRPPQGMGQTGGAGVGPAGARQPDSGDVSMLGRASQPAAPFVDYSALEGLGAKKVEDDGVDWASLTAPPAEEKRRGGDPFEKDVATGGGGEDEDDEFTVFDGFGQDNRPVKESGAGGGGREGMTWDAERKMWERKNESAFGSGFGAFGSRGGGSSPWDLRGSSFRSPASLLRIRSQVRLHSGYTAVIVVT